jgi:hypothetical protein
MGVGSVVLACGGPSQAVRLLIRLHVSHDNSTATPRSSLAKLTRYATLLRTSSFPVRWESTKPGLRFILIAIAFQRYALRILLNLFDKSLRSICHPSLTLNDPNVMCRLIRLCLSRPSSLAQSSNWAIRKPFLCSRGFRSSRFVLPPHCIAARSCTGRFPRPQSRQWPRSTPLQDSLI